MEDQLLKAAWAAREKAYAPYSRFKVGAAILTAGGSVFSGCNVEAANYGCTLCAERTAIVKAVSEGHLSPGGLEKVLVATQTARPTAPCGSCRQMIEEFGTGETKVLLSSHPSRVDAVYNHAELLPHSFNAGNLE